MDATILNQISRIRERELRRASSLGYLRMASAASGRSVAMVGDRFGKRTSLPGEERRGLLPRLGEIRGETGEALHNRIGLVGVSLLLQRLRQQQIDSVAGL